MRSFETLDYSESGDVAQVVLRRPRTDIRMVRELTAVCDHLEDESSVRFAVFRGINGIFSEGIDFEDFRPDQTMDIHGFNKWEKLCVRVERLSKVTIAALDGVARGGGVQLALVCDARIATPATTLQLDEVQKGFLPGMGTYRLAKYVGLGNAKRLIMQSPVVSADDAAAMGILDEVCDDLDAGIAGTIAAFGPAHTVAVTLARRLLNESFATPFEHAIGNFLAAQHRAITQSAFLQTIEKARKGNP